MTPRLLVATNNPGKLAEFRRLLEPVVTLGAQVVGPSEIGLQLEVAEPHHSYADNARDKALAFCRASGLPTLADDSGIEVAALAWGPGPRSARMTGAGAAGADAVLRLLGDATDRRARMVCWLALAIPNRGDSLVELFSGTVDGTIAGERRGTGGFGYDPIFLLPSGMTTAELPPRRKDAVSHRGRAVAAALPRLREVLAPL